MHLSVNGLGAGGHSNDTAAAKSAAWFFKKRKNGGFIVLSEGYFSKISCSVAFSLQYEFYPFLRYLNLPFEKSGKLPLLIFEPPV